MATSWQGHVRRGALVIRHFPPQTKYTTTIYLQYRYFPPQNIPQLTSPIPRYQPLPYGTHFGEEEWSTPGPLYEQNTMLLMSDSYDRFFTNWTQISAFYGFTSLDVYFELMRTDFISF